MIGLRRTLMMCLLALAGLSGAQDDRTIQRQVMAAVDVYKSGKVDDAVKSLEGLRISHPGNADVQAWLGFLYLRTGRAEEAGKLLEMAAVQRPTDVSVLNNLGNAYLANSKLDKALEQYQKVIAIDPKMFEPYYNSGTIYLRQHAWQKALNATQDAAQIAPSDPFAQNNIGVSYQGLKDDVRAAAAFKRAADLRPDNKTFARNAGLTLGRLRKPEALAYLQRAVTGTPDAELAMSLAEANTRAGNLQEALKLYETCKDSQANSSTFWFNLGVLRAKCNDDAGAETAYRKALEINTNDLDTLNNLALLLYRKGKYDDAELLFDKLSGLNPSSIAAKVNLGASAMRAGDTKKAISAWKDAVRADPGRMDTRLDLANALYSAGDYEGARYHYNQVLLQRSTQPEALNGMGLCHFQAGKFPQAEAAFRSAIEANPKMGSAYNNLALTLERMNRKADAVKVLEEAAKLLPDDEDIRQNLSRLRNGG